MTGAAQSGAETKKDPGSQGSGGLKTLLVGGVGGLLTTAVIVGMLHTTSVSHNGSQLSLVSQDQIAAAASTLTPDARPTLVAEAEQCTVPLAYLTVASTSGERTVRIRSGSYVSPPLTISPTPQRIAIPFPTPYSTGLGQISIEGDTTGALVSLYPTWRIDTGGTVTSIWWDPKKPC